MLQPDQHYCKIYLVIFLSRSFRGQPPPIALIFDRDQKPMPWLLIIAVFALLLAILRTARGIWALERVIMLITAPLPEEIRGGS
jgi:hypothetical protein